MQESFLPANNAKRQRSQETFSPTSPARLGRIVRDPDRVLITRFVLENLALARFPRTGGRADVQRQRVRHSKCKSLRLFRIVRHGASSNPVLDGRGKAPCTEKTEWARAHGFPAR